MHTLHASSHYNNKLKYKCTLTPPLQAALYRPIYIKRHVSFWDTCPDLYSCLSVLCKLYLATYLAAVCTMQCQAAFNTHYVAFCIAYIAFVLFYDHF